MRGCRERGAPKDGAPCCRCGRRFGRRSKRGAATQRLWVWQDERRRCFAVAGMGRWRSQGPRRRRRLWSRSWALAARPVHSRSIRAPRSGQPRRRRSWSCHASWIKHLAQIHHCRPFLRPCSWSFPWPSGFFRRVLGAAETLGHSLVADFAGELRYESERWISSRTRHSS